MGLKHHKIGNAYDAYHFIYDHPKFMLRERHPVTSEEADQKEAQGYLITRDRSGKCYREWRHLHRHAIDFALDIFYAKVDSPGGNGRVNNDPKKNKYVACWLEFGQEEYMYVSDDDDNTYLMSNHDTVLDTGGATFDQALIRLARLIRKHYGDYKPRSGRYGACGRPVCADCKESKALMKKMKLG